MPTMTPERMPELDLQTLNRWNLYRQHLAPESHTQNLRRIVKDIAGLHATFGTTPYLSLLARSPEFARDDLDRELYQKHSLGKVRCVRGTVYVHTKDMIPIAYRATARLLLPTTRRYMQAGGVTENEYRRVSRAILKLLAGRELTASALKSALGTKLDVSSILYHMCDLGLIIRGWPEKGWRDKNHAYARFADAFPDVELSALSEREAETALVRAYLHAFGPVTETDAVWWTGLGKTRVRAALAQLAPEVTNVRPADLCPQAIMLRKDVRRLAEPDPSGLQAVRLIPVLDSYPMGYKERDRLLDPADRERAFGWAGNITSTILVGGRVAGVWDFERKPHPCIKLYFFRDVDRPLLRRTCEEAERVGACMADGPVRLRTCEGMIPLRSRTAGGIMSPLQGMRVWGAGEFAPALGLGFLCALA